MRVSRKKSVKRKEERLIENGRGRDQEHYERGEKKENKKILKILPFLSVCFQF